ncbi:hypothetical protein, partial [Kineococcus glutinatus]|uniref:hypothetical protein n=1 Tax=Kineococcus glutinatus TaxID=1070872 RepID=UPI0031E89FC1
MSLPEFRTDTTGATPAETGRPSQFRREIEGRVDSTRAAVDRATAEGEDYLAEVHLAELESLLRIAAEHDVELPAARDYLHSRSPRVLDLTAVDAQV